MKSDFEEARGLLIKADHDLKIAEIGLEAGGPLDAVCFHLQQMAEKLIKAALISRGVAYPFTHDLQELLKLGQGAFPVFLEFSDALAAFTPYAVRMRYDEALYPDESEARTALAAVRKLRTVVHGLLPPEIHP